MQLVWNANNNLHVLYRVILFPVTLSSPNYPKPPYFRYFVSPFISLMSVELETSNLVGRLTVASAGPRMANHPRKGRD